MNLSVSGGCLCGQYRYEISGTPIAMFNCHCRDCQQSSGGPYSPVVYVAKSSFRVIRGEMQHYWTDSEPGERNKRGFCAQCGARVTGGETDESIGILASSLDDPSIFRPHVNIYVGEAQPWDRIPDDIPAAQGSTP